MSRNNRIIALASEAYGRGGGIAQYNRDLFDALRRFWTIEVLPRHGSLEKEMPPAGVILHAAKRGRMCYAIASLLAVAKSRPSIIFCGHLFMAPLAAALAWVFGSKLIIQAHGIEAWHRPKLLRRRSVAQANLVLCVSRHTRSQVLAWCDIAPERVVILPNTIRDAFVPAGRAMARAKFGLRDEQVLLTVGRLDARERYKGHETIIDMLPSLSSEGCKIIYLIAGDGDDRDRIEKYARDRRVDHQIRFQGLVPQESLPDLYRAADVFVLASSGEGFGIAFLEAMASGTIAVGLDAGGASDALGDGELGIAAAPYQLLQTVRRALKLARSSDQTRLAKAVKDRFGRHLFVEHAARLFQAYTG